MIGVVVSAAVIGAVLVLLNKAWGFGSKELAAPQATMMKMIVEGVMDGDLPWSMVMIGVFLGIFVEILQIPVLAVAIGVYLPLELSAACMVGGLVRYLTDKGIGKTRKPNSEGGILFCSGMIAGEGLVGVLLAFLAVGGITEKIDLSGTLDTGLPGSLILLALLIFAIIKAGTAKASETSPPKQNASS